MYQREKMINQIYIPLNGGKEISRVSNVKHLGITRTTNGKGNLEERLKTGRQTIYALLGSGLHARVGMSPIVLQKIWKTYVVPRYIYMG